MENIDLTEAARIHPELKEYFAQGGQDAVSKVTDLVATRTAMAVGLRSVLSSMPASYLAGVQKDEMEIPMRDGTKIKALVYKPSNANASGSAPLAVLYHGGGHVVGIPEMEENNCLILVRNHGCVAVSVDYRLAPEHPFPIPVEDCWDAFKWVAAHACQLGADGSKGFLVGGASAGANLAAAVSHLARDEQVSPALTGIFLAVPSCLPHDAVPEKYKDRYKSFAESKSYEAGNPAAMLEVMSYYQGDSSSPLFAPFNWPSGHAGLPRTYLQVCGMDPLRDEGLLYEYVLRTEGGVQTKMDFYPGMPHGFWALYPQLEGSKRAAADSVQGWNWLMSGKSPSA